MSPLALGGLALGAWAISRRATSSPGETETDVRLVEPEHARGFRLRVDAARAFDAAARDASETPRVTSAWRSSEQQARLYELWKAGMGNRAAPPGRSWHEVGLAVDARGSRTWEAAMMTHGWRRTVPDEPWHWEYRP